jgi:hypothetical protein
MIVWALTLSELVSKVSGQQHISQYQSMQDTTAHTLREVHVVTAEGESGRSFVRFALDVLALQ